ncbi:MAG: pyridoxamine 5'-phosphate oxidase family protein [Actinobacteria bacterium]|nr:MAG: pyridoxamine 5'-phosphate oxidase family protein [Actinomycetota bacterium]
MTLPPSSRTEVKRLPERARYDTEIVHGILDDALVCHVGFVIDGQPVVIPTIHARSGDRLYLHGSPANRMLRTLKQPVDVCVTVTLVDGLVLARSAFHHSMNYRSVVVFGSAREVTDPAEKMTAFRALVDHIAPRRWDTVRAPNEKEIRSTLVLALALAEASAKIRTGPPLDDEADYALPVWAGELPLRTVPGVPVDDPRLAPGAAVPDHVTDWRRSR